MESFLRKSLLDNMEQLRKIVSTPAFRKAPAEELYVKKSRSILFRLEAIARICRNIYSKKKFNELNDPFKILEDGLGKIEYYDDFYNEFSASKIVPKKFSNFFLKRRKEEFMKLNESIASQKLGNPEFFIKIQETINNTTWLSAADEREALILFLSKQCNKITDDLDSGKLNFKDIENGIHEVRRKIRWLSIYAAVVNGVIQLKKTKSPNSSLKIYLTKEIINLPYNQMPPAPKGVKSIFIQSQNFYALSWIINELGKLKDEGLKIFAVDEGLSSFNPENRKVLRKTLLKDVHTEEVICEVAENLVDEFIYKHGILERIRRDLNRNKLS